MATPTDIPLSQLAPALAERYPGTRIPSYRVLYARVLDGRLQADVHNGRYYIRRENIPAVAEVFGLADRVAA